MRILFTTVQRYGHLQPLLPIARAAIEAGHEVAVACAASFAPVVDRAGLPTFQAGFDERGRSIYELFPGYRSVPEQEIAFWTIPKVHIAIYAAAMAPDLLTIAREWQPDVIVRDAMEFGGCLAAEVLSLPHAAVRTGSTTSRYGLRHRVAAPLAQLREVNGLPPDPYIEMPFRYLHLAPEPPGFALPGEAAPPTTHLLRPQRADEAGGEGVPDWLSELPHRPTILASLGTVFSAFPSGRAIYTAILEAMRDEPVNLIVTVGPNSDPLDFGPPPPHVHIERYVPHSLLLPYCDLVVHHGGFGTITGTLQEGLPMIVIPISADQPYNAACCVAMGVGTSIGPDERSPESIRAAVRTVLTDPGYRERAERVRDAMTALPAPEHGVALIQRLVEERTPLVTV